MSDDYFLQLYITRHGESYGNLPQSERPWKSTPTPEQEHDPQLTPLGEEQAKALGERLSVRRFNAIFSSPLIRAVATACETASRQPGGTIPVDLLGDLREKGTPWDYPGYSLEQIKEKYSFVRTYHTIVPFQERAVLDGEDESQRNDSALRRGQDCISFIRERFYSGENVLLVAHGTFNTYLIRAALGLGNEKGFNFCQENTGLTKVKYFKDGSLRLAYMNDTSHLFDVNPELSFSL